MTIGIFVKHLLEPIFEARFWHVSYGFRPGRGCHGALEHLRMAMRPRAKGNDGRRHRTPYHWVIEGDIKGSSMNADRGTPVASRGPPVLAIDGGTSPFGKMKPLP